VFHATVTLGAYGPPTPAGEAHCSCVFAAVVVPQLAEPIVTVGATGLTALIRFEPAIVSVCPPIVPPVFGVIDVTTGFRHAVTTSGYAQS
jgi:hypothetical protein